MRAPACAEDFGPCVMVRPIAFIVAGLGEESGQELLVKPRFSAGNKDDWTEPDVQIFDCRQWLPLSSATPGSGHRDNRESPDDVSRSVWSHPEFVHLFREVFAIVGDQMTKTAGLFPHFPDNMWTVFVIGSNRGNNRALVVAEALAFGLNAVRDNRPAKAFNAMVFSATAGSSERAWSSAVKWLAGPWSEVGSDFNQDLSRIPLHKILLPDPDAHKSFKEVHDIVMSLSGRGEELS